MIVVTLLFFILFPITAFAHSTDSLIESIMHQLLNPHHSYIGLLVFLAIVLIITKHKVISIPLKRIIRN